jgi:EAL and modified HD-GYP domain-containing signal transduction protein
VSHLSLPDEQISRPPAFSQDSVHLVRRPVLAVDLSVWGYQLVCPAAGGAAQGASEARLLNALAELGVRQLVSERVAIVPIGRETLLGQLPLPAAERIVLELRIEPSDVDDALLKAAEERLDEGFQLALSSDFGAPALKPLLERVGLVRVPFATLEMLDLEALKQSGRSLRVWVDDVKDTAAFREARKYKAQYYSGDFLFRPSSLEARKAPRNLFVLVELMEKVRQEDVKLSAIEDILRNDAGLSVTLLLGLGEFSRWLTLIGLSEASSKPNEVLVTALIRAKTCEAVAQKASPEKNGSFAFMVGLLSLLDAMLDKPLEKILDELPVSTKLRAALLEQSGFEGEVLAAVLDYERGLTPEPVAAGDALITTGLLDQSWRQAIVWADRLRGSMPPKPPSKPPASRSF